MQFLLGKSRLRQNPHELMHQPNSWILIRSATLNAKHLHSSSLREIMNHDKQACEFCMLRDLKYKYVLFVAFLRCRNELQNATENL
jgi:hypothetical protein